MSAMDKSMMSQAGGGNQQRSMLSKFTDFVNKKLNPTRQELLNTLDVTIVTRKRMRIYAYSNLICFILELGIFAVVQWV